MLQRHDADAGFQAAGAASKWPCMDLVPLTLSVWLRACSPKTASMAWDSLPSPAGVAVAWAFT